MSGINRNRPSLETGDIGDITMTSASIGGVLICIRGRFGLLRLFRLLCRTASRRTAKVHHDTRLPAVESKYIVPALAHGGLHHNTHSRRIELRRAYTGDEGRVYTNILLILRHDPSILHIHNNPRGIRKNALPVRHRTI